MKVRKIESFNTSAQFWAYHNALLQKDMMHEAGKISEEYFEYWHLYMNEDYMGGGIIYDTNRGDLIPQQHIDAVNGQTIFGRRGNSKGLDKLAVTPDGRYDIMSDKTTKKWVKNAGDEHIKGLLSILDHPITNVRKVILNTNYSGVSHKFAEYQEDRLCVFTLEDFLPAATDGEGIQRDKEMFKWIKADKRGKRKAVNIKFVPRDPQQNKYIDAAYNHARDELQKVGYAKSYCKAVGAFGKSIVDPVLMAKFQKDFWQVRLTNSPAPVSIHCFHSRVTLAENGKRAVRFRKSMGLNEDVLVVSGCEVGDDDEENCANINRYPRAMSVRKIVKFIKDSMSAGRPVVILTLYHHSDTLALVQKALRRSYPGFKYWGKCKDETDWPCSNYHSSFAPMLDDRVEAVHTHGSTGTERVGDPDKDYGTNNIEIHGPCVYDYTWADAEKDGLVKEFNLILQKYSHLDIKHVYPQLVNNEGKINYKKRYNIGGRPVAGRHPTAMQIIKMAALAEALKRYPCIQRVLGFSTFIKQNMIVQENFKIVAAAVLGSKTKEDREIANLHIEVMNDKKYRGGALTTYEEQIKRAKSKPRYLLLSCRLFNRGYDDSAPVGWKGSWEKHHAAIHFTMKSDVNLCQEIWRVTRLDSSRDKYAYYILPMIYDMDDDDPNWEKDVYDLFKKIMKQHKRIMDEIIYAADNGSDTEAPTKQNKIPLHEQLDPKFLRKLATSISLDSDGREIPNPLAEAHDWLIGEYMKLERPWVSNTEKGKVNDVFLKKFGHYFPGKCRAVILRWINNDNAKNDPLRAHKDQNLIAFDEYIEDQKNEFNRMLLRCRAIIESKSKMMILPGPQFCSAKRLVAKEAGIDYKKANDFLKDHIGMSWYHSKLNDNRIWKNSVYVIQCFIEEGQDCESLDEATEKVWHRLEDEGFDLGLVSIKSIKNNFLVPQVKACRDKQKEILSKCSIKTRKEFNNLVDLLKHRTAVLVRSFDEEGNLVRDMNPKGNKRKLHIPTVEWLLEKEMYVKDEELWNRDRVTV